MVASLPNTLFRHVFLRSDVPSDSVARDPSSYRLSIIVKAIAATVARDSGSDSRLPKLSK